MRPSASFVTEVCGTFALGTPVSDPVPVSGGLSNRLYRLQTGQGDFAIKRMVANATAPDFKANVEASFQVELLARDRGIAMPEPVPVPTTGEALASIDDGGHRAWVRVHHWVEAKPVDPTDVTPQDLASIARVVANMHTIAAPAVHDRSPMIPHRDWQTMLPPGLASPDVFGAIDLMEQIISEGYATASSERVMSHRDLDAKNVLRTPDGELLIVDWDAAGPVNANWDMAGTALDWSGVRECAISTEDFDRFLSAYESVDGGLDRQVLTPTSFAGWCEGVLDWLWFNLGRAASADRAERQLGASEIRVSAEIIPPAARWIVART